MFKLATTSFIKKDTRLNNALFLSDKVNEVELLYFDSKNQYDFPNDKEILQLKEINLSYNIHMPIDLNLIEKKNWEIMHIFASKLKILKPTTLTIHPVDNQIFFNMLEIFADTFHPVSVENIDNNLRIFDTILNMNVNICLDIGHAILFDIDIQKFIEKYGEKITHIHLHGVLNNKDHKDIGFLDKDLLKFIMDFAISKKLTLCIEVFNEKDFNKSMKIMENYI